MKFNNLNDVFQFFANEYIIPGNKVLIINGNNNEIEYLKVILEFLNCEIKFETNLFETNWFDVIINLNEMSLNVNSNFKNLKKNGVLFVKDEILNGNDYYYHSNEIFTVIIY